MLWGELRDFRTDILSQRFSHDESSSNVLCWRLFEAWKVRRVRWELFGARGLMDSWVKDTNFNVESRQTPSESLIFSWLNSQFGYQLGACRLCVGRNVALIWWFDVKLHDTMLVSACTQYINVPDRSVLPSPFTLQASPSVVCYVVTLKRQQLSWLQCLKLSINCR